MQRLKFRLLKTGERVRSGDQYRDYDGKWKNDADVKLLNGIMWNNILLPFRRQIKN